MQIVIKISCISARASQRGILRLLCLELILGLCFNVDNKSNPAMVIM